MPENVCYILKGVKKLVTICSESYNHAWFIHLILLLPQSYYKRAPLPMNNCPLILKHEREFSLTYTSKVSVGFQHHIFVETPLGRIQQSPFFPCEVDMYIIIGHCILKYSIHLYNRKHDFDNTANVYFFDSIVI